MWIYVLAFIAVVAIGLTIGGLMYGLLWIDAEFVIEGNDTEDL